MVHHSFSKCLGCFGPRAAKNKVASQQLWIESLLGWLEHLKTGMLNVYVDSSCGGDENELLAQADALFS
jgi:hypothetical protein